MVRSSSNPTPRPLIRTSAILSSSLLLASLLTACGQQPVEIGVVLPLSGEHQALGESSRNGLELALAEIKAAGDERFSLRYSDSASDAQQAGKTVYVTALFCIMFLCGSVQLSGCCNSMCCFEDEEQAAEETAHAAH